MTTPYARRFLSVLEPLVTSIYFSPEANEEYAELGLVDPWVAYFSSRSAAMGQVSGDVVAASFYNFNPELVRRSVRWEIAAPPEVYAARLRGVRRTLERLLAVDGALPDVTRAVELLRPAVEACSPEGRPVAAPHAALPWPDEPLTAMWHGANVLREFRGDGHVAVLLTHNVGPVEAVLLQIGYLGLDERRRAMFFTTRAWEEPDQRKGEDALRERGFLDAEGRLTDGGGKFRGMIEHDTDRAAAAPFAVLGDERCEELLGILQPLAVRILERRGVPSAAGRLDPAHPLRP
jgi:hypothetical protein